MIETAKARDGLKELLFWPSVDGNQLTLRPDFALWAFDYSQRRHTQADVYFTICAVLHAWRAEHAEGVSLEHKRLLLAPRNFVRFNDGVIQASLLRSAMAGELDYRASPDQSELMESVLAVVFENFGSRRGEACIEFLLALLEGRLRLVKKDVYKLLEALHPKLNRLAGRNPNAAFGRELCIATLEELDKDTDKIPS
jgi:hypothetical protein